MRADSGLRIKGRCLPNNDYMATKRGSLPVAVIWTSTLQSDGKDNRRGCSTGGVQGPKDGSIPISLNGNVSYKKTGIEECLSREFTYEEQMYANGNKAVLCLHISISHRFCC